MSDDNGRSLPSQWAQAPLSAIAQINPRLDRTIASDDVVVDFVPMRAVEPEGGGLLRPEVSTYGKVKKGYTAFRSGDVIMAKITPCMENGKTCVVPELQGAACFGSTEFHVVRAEQGIDPRWIANYLLQHSTRYAAQRQMSGGVGQMRVPASFLDSLTLPVAPESEQSRVLDAIDELLSDLDAGVEALERVHAKLKQFGAAVLKSAVEGELTAQWRNSHPGREPASQLLKRILAERRRRWEENQLQKFKEAGKTPPKNWENKYPEPVVPDTTNLPPLPAGWGWASLDQLSEVQGGLQKSPKRKPKHNHYPYLRVANVLRGALDLNELHRFELTDSELRRLRLEPGDILVVEGNGSRTEIGRCALWNGEIENCVHQNHIIRCRPIAGFVSKFAILFLNSPAGQLAIQQAASSTSGLYTLSVTKIEKLPVPLPSSAEQQMVVEIAEDQISIIEHLQAHLDLRLRSSSGLRQSILRHAFAGQLAPQDASDKQASELLKRIGAEREERERQAEAAKNSKQKTTTPRKRRSAKSRK